MDMNFRLYGGRYLQRYGTADNGPSGRRSRSLRGRISSGRGFWPWPNTARACGLL